MKKKEFRKYLSLFLADGTVDDKVSFANKAETVLGCDLEDVVHDFHKIADAQKQLSTQPSQVRKAFLYYVGFTYSPKVKNNAADPDRKTGITAEPNPIIFAKGPIVRYREDVPVAEQNEALRLALEQEYPFILEYAVKILEPFADNNLQQTLPYIPVYLSKEMPTDVHPVSKSYLNRLKRKRDEGKNLTEEEYHILETKRIENCVLGRFFGGVKPYIEIYYKHLPLHNMAMCISSAVNCLAHEYMHFLHYWYAAQHNVKKPFHNKKLTEALADFFGVLYSLFRGKSDDNLIAEEKYFHWKKMKYTGWPYAYAIYFLAKRHRNSLFDYSSYDIDTAAKKLKDVFRRTKDPKDAYTTLMQ